MNKMPLRQNLKAVKSCAYSDADDDDGCYTLSEVEGGGGGGTIFNFLLKWQERREGRIWEGIYRATLP